MPSDDGPVPTRARIRRATVHARVHPAVAVVCDSAIASAIAQQNLSAVYSIQHQLLDCNRLPATGLSGSPVLQQELIRARAVGAPTKWAPKYMQPHSHLVGSSHIMTRPAARQETGRQSDRHCSQLLSHAAVLMQDPP